MKGEGFAALGVAHELGPGAGLHDLGQPAGMIGLGMVADYEIDGGWILNGGNAGKQVFYERCLNGVDQCRLLILYQVGVVGGAALRLVAVKIANGPVNVADPDDAVTQCLIHTSTPSRTFRFSSHEQLPLERDPA
jgi:hypothetical protein